MSRIFRVITVAGLLTMGLLNWGLPQAVANSHNSILKLMVEVITPASDELWGVEDPITDEEWQALDEAALLIITAFEQAKLGGSGPNDDIWASEQKWKDYAEEEIAAGQAARNAIAARDLDSLEDAGSELYSPCESCHREYHPGLQDQE